MIISAVAVHLTVSLLFLVGVRWVFVRRGGARHRAVVGVVGAVLVLEAIFIGTGSVSTLRFAVAVAVYASSAVVFIWAARTNGRARLSLAFSPDLPTHVQRSGPYSWVRHPCYASYIACAGAGCVAAGRWPLVSVVVIVVLVYAAAAKFEEQKFARSPWATVYRVFASEVGMFLPIRSLRTRTRRLV
jgi:protein-S-isoprenylcysteine O-methyltransferase Ste14